MLVRPDAFAIHRGPGLGVNAVQHSDSPFEQVDPPVGENWRRHLDAGPLNLPTDVLSRVGPRSGSDVPRAAGLNREQESATVV